MSSSTKQKPNITGLIADINAIIADTPQEQPMAQEHFDADVVVIGAGPGGSNISAEPASTGAAFLRRR